MRVFTVESLEEYYIQDVELFGKITGIDLDRCKGVITLTNDQIIELINSGVFIRKVSPPCILEPARCVMPVRQR